MNSLTNIGKDEQKNGKTKLYTPRHKRWGITSVDLDILFEPWHGISNNVVYATSKTSDQPAHIRSLMGGSASRLDIV